MAANYVIKNDISIDEFTTNRAYGVVSSTAGDFGLVAEWNHPIKRLTLYVGRDSIKRIRLEKMDNTYISVGSDSCDVTPRQLDWNFAYDERFTEIKIYLDSPSKALVGLKMVTNKQSLEVVSQERKYISQDVPVGSGMCMGMFGNAERTVTALGFAMLNKLPSQGRLQRLEREQREREKQTDSGI